MSSKHTAEGEALAEVETRVVERVIIPAHNGKYVIKSVTPEGVTAYCASDVPRDALDGLMIRLLKQMRKLEKKTRAVEL